MSTGIRVRVQRLCAKCFSAGGRPAASHARPVCFSRGKEMQKRTHTHPAERLHTQNLAAFFFFEKESLTTPRGASHTSMCPHAPTHVHAKHSSSALAFFAKEKVHLEISSSKFLPWISRCDLIFVIFFVIYIIHLSTYTLSPYIIMKTICNFTSYKQTPQHLLETGINIKKRKNKNRIMVLVIFQ